jgi:L-alanine-DL-glutamate epimerase-like enolase superfamily enzyme
VSTPADGPRGNPLVDKVTVAVYRVPTDQPEADGTLAWDATTVVVVDIDAAGQHGTGWTYSSAAAATLIEEMLAGVVRGRSALDPPGANEAMIRAVRNVGRAGVASTAIAAVDIAMWDLKARLLDLPLTRLLGQVRDAVPVYGSGGFTTYDDRRTTEQVEQWVADCGVRAVKIKIGESWGAAVERDLERVRLVRDLLGPQREVFVDANGGYSRGQAVRVGHRLDELGVAWFEEPVSSDDLAGLAVIRQAVQADVAAGEYGYDLTYFRRMAQSGAIDCLQVDVTRCGGITEFIRAAAVAASYGLQVSAHCAPHLHAAVAASVPNLRHVEYFHDHTRIEESLLFDAAPARDGVLAADRGRPGLGVELKRSDAEHYRVA